MSHALNLFKRKKNKKKKKGKEIKTWPVNGCKITSENFLRNFSSVVLQQDLVIPPRFGAGWKLWMRTVFLKHKNLFSPIG